MKDSLTEPEAGSDAGAIRTRARRDGDRYVLSGSKQFITSGQSADLALVFAVTDPAAGKKGISAFLVPTDTPGFRVARVERTMGQRGSDHCQLVFEACVVPAEDMLGGEGEGYRICAGQSRGRAHRRRRLRERRTFGRPIIEHQAVAFHPADMATRLKAAELMVLHAAGMRARAEPCLREASMAKLLATEAAEEVCRWAIQTLGGYGYLEDFPVERIHRDVRVCQIFEGTSDIQRLVIGREIAADPGYVGVA